MSNRTIFSAMGLAAIILVAAVSYVAFFSSDAEGCTAPNCVSTGENCSKYRIERQRNAHIKDSFVKGIVDIGLVEDTNVSEAAAFLKTVGTSTYMPIAPYQQAAFICVKDGHEQEWVDRMKTFEWVEWAHVEGVTPIDTLGN